MMHALTVNGAVLSRDGLIVSKREEPCIGRSPTTHKIVTTIGPSF